MNQRHIALLGALAVAVATAACSPTDGDTGTKVKANLTADTTVKAASIDVGVQKKVVTLTGTVDTVAIKEQAVVVARKTDGVGEVVDQLVVKQRDSGPGERGSGPGEHGPGPGHGRDMMGKGMGAEEHKEAPKEEKRP